MSTLSIASDSNILKHSHGEVLNFRRHYNKGHRSVAEIGGLFCPIIFGPEEPYTCLCGITKKLAEKTTCPKCGVDYVDSTERKHRMGHIDLGIKIISNPMFYKVIAPILEISITALSKFCLSSANEVSFEIEENPNGCLWSEDETRYSIDIKAGNEGSIWCPNDLYNKMKELKIDGVLTLKKSKSEIGQLYYSIGKSVYDLFNQYVYVTPPADRDRRVVNQRIVYHEENIIYLRLIREKYRIERVLVEDTMDEETRKRFFQFESKMIHNLLDKFYIKGFTFGVASEKGKLAKLSSKHGLFRQNLLGKRVDFSGRSVITAGPFLKPDEIGIPMAMLHELFKPILIRELAKRFRKEDKRFNQYKALRLARREHESFSELTKKMIEEICPKYDVFMNRAPSLHRYSVMGHRIVVTYDKAIYFPLLTMVPYNADCISETTKIYTLEWGSKTVPEIIDLLKENGVDHFYVWSRNEQGIQVPGKAHSPRFIRNTDTLYEITLDNGEVIQCTDNHQFKMKDLSYVEARNLKIGDSVSPFRWEVKKDRFGIERAKIYDEPLGWTYQYLISYERHYLEKRGAGYQIHHKDHNARNDSPENLQKLTIAEHARHHITEYNKSEKHTEDIINSKCYIESMQLNAFKRNKLQSNILKDLNSESHIRDAISLGWHARSYAEIKALGYKEITEEIFDLHRPGKLNEIRRLGGLEEVKRVAIDFKYIDQAISYFNMNPEKLPENIESYKVKRRGGINFLNPSNRNKVFDQIFKQIEDNNFQICEDTWNKTAKENSCWFNWNFMLESIGRPLETYLKTRNHKITSIKILKGNFPVYDITVEKYHNYALSAGCYTHNCDGDQMAIHVPLTFESMKECRNLFHVRKHIMFSHEDTPNISFTNEIALGAYLLTRYWEKPTFEFKLASNNRKEIESLYVKGELTLDDIVKFYNKDPKIGKIEPYITNVGSLLVEEIAGIKIDWVLGKKGCSKLISDINWKNGNRKQDKTISQLHRLQTLFLEVATKSGLSIKYDDTLKSKETKEILEKAKIESLDYEGFERTKFWDKIMNEESDKWFANVNHNHSLYIMGQSGARVQEPQVKTMIVGKSLLRKPISDKYPMGISTNAIIHSLSEGLNPIEYMETCGPARLAFAQNAFFVPASGYMERQLVSVGRNLVITTNDCGNEELLPFKKELCINMYSPEYGIIRPEMLDSLPEILHIRTPITCKHNKGLCQKCCGYDPANREYWKLGTNIGVIQGQEYASVTSQSAMRGKHLSGILRVDQIGKNSDDAIVKFAYLTGCKLTTIGLNKDIETDKFVDIEGESYHEKAVNFSNKIVETSGNRHLIYATTLVRGMSDVVELDNGRFGLRSRGVEYDEPKIYTVHNAILNDPSWLRKLGYGYTRKVIERALTHGEKIQGTSAEQIMRGGLIHDCTE